MPTVPQFGREVKLNGSPLPYEHYNLNGYMFGQGQAQAAANAAEGLNALAKISLDINKKLEETKVVEFNNAVENWRQTNLLDKENGYLVKQGSDAAGKSGEVMQSYDDFVADWMKTHRLSRTNTARVNEISAHKRSGIMQNATYHDLQETNKYAATEGKNGIDNAIINAVSERNNPDAIGLQIANIKQITQWQGGLQNWDEATTKMNIQNNVSALHQAILDTKIQEGDLTAKDYFENHKEEINPQLHSRYIGAIKNEEDKYKAREIADEIFTMYPDSPEQGFKELEKRKEDMDIDQYDNTEHRLSARYTKSDRMKQFHDDEVRNDIYEQIDNKLTNGEIITVDEVNLSAIRDPKERMAMRNYINNLNSTGDTDTKYYILDELNEMSMNDAQSFRKLNLDKYRPYLSSSDLKTLKNRQNKIINMTPTQIQDDNEILKNAIEEFHLTGHTGHLGKGNISDTFINSAKSYVREYELKHGKTLSGPQLKNVIYEFAKTMKYKDADAKEKANMYELYAEGMNKQAGFTRDVLSDWENAEKSKGSPLTDEEKYKLVNKRVAKIMSADNKKLADTLSENRQNDYTPKLGDIWQGHQITSLYGKRTSPKPGATSEHMGIDLAYKNNEVFKAYASGVVVNVSYDNKLGNYVDVKAADGTIHRYGHANKIDVRKGQHISAGDFLGRAGATGVATGPHVHYAQIRNGQFVNPLGGNNTTNSVASSNNQMVKMQAPNGKIVYVPKSMVEQAIRQGGKKV